ncbi:MAG TPA: hypothetical protein H9866_04410 [Candidatus Tidjanibacter gallistercoris]|nr:hypothetical protein [Candidatus Tidjanibacter gallistercoris]
MKHLRHSFLAAAGAMGVLAFAACNEAGETVSGEEDFILHASIAQPVAAAAPATLFGASGREAETQRTVIQEGTEPHPIVWKTDDGIIIHFDTGVQGAMRVFNIQSGIGTSEAEFVYSGFAYSSDPDVQVPMELPDTYHSLIAGYPAMFVTITPENREVVLEAPREIYLGLENVVDYPMYGAAGADGKINFVCPFGLICFPVTGDNITVKAVYIDTTAANKEVTGRFQINEETYETTFLNSPHGSEFEIVWTGTVQLTDTPSEFYAIVPAGEYAAGTQFRFATSDGGVIIKHTKQPFTVTRSRILNLPLLDVGN